MCCRLENASLHYFPDILSFFKSLHSIVHFVLSKITLIRQNVVCERAITLNTTFHNPSSYVLDITGLLQAVGTRINCDGNKKTMKHILQRTLDLERQHSERFVFVSLNRGRDNEGRRGGNKVTTMRQSQWQCQANTKCLNPNRELKSKKCPGAKNKFFCRVRLQLRHLSPDTKHYDLPTWQQSYRQWLFILFQ